MKSVRKNSQGIAHVALILVIVLVAAIGGVGYYVAARNTKPAKTSTITSSASQAVNITPDATCLKLTSNDTDFCKFAAIANNQIKQAYRSTMTSVDKDGKKTVTVVESDLNSNVSAITKENDKETFAIVVVGKDSYTKNEETGSWSKYPVQSDSSSVPNNDLHIDMKDQENIPEAQRIQYKKIGKETCGDDTCFKYQETDPAQPGVESFIWFSDKDYVLRKYSTKNTDGSTYSFEVTLISVTVSVPSPVQ